MGNKEIVSTLDRYIESNYLQRKDIIQTEVSPILKALDNQNISQGAKEQCIDGLLQSWFDDIINVCYKKWKK